LTFSKRKNASLIQERRIFSNFRFDIQLVLNLRNLINVKFGCPACFYHERGRFKAKIAFLRLFASIYRLFLNQEAFFADSHDDPSFLDKNRIFATFRFNTQYAFPESGKCFFADSHDDPLFLGKIRIFATFLFNT
jgi:hypothetical protein